LKVSCVNEIANICELTGGDITLIAEGLGLDPRIGRRFLDAGVGWGGSCFGKDVGELIAVAADHGYDAKLLRAARDVNEWQRQLVVKKLRRRLRGLRGRRIGLLGLAFKPGTDDVRTAPALALARRFASEGAIVVGHDPMAAAEARAAVPELETVEDPWDAIAGAHCVVICTEWAEYRDLDPDRLRREAAYPIVVDGRNVLDPDRVAAAGLTYLPVGRPARGMQTESR
jgi:UDPglucose 6-dehydrogenase